MKMKIGTINNIVEKINLEILENFENELAVLELKSLGGLYAVEFLGACIWNSESPLSDDLEYDLRIEMNTIIDSFKNITL